MKEVFIRVKKCMFSVVLEDVKEIYNKISVLIVFLRKLKL